MNVLVFYGPDDPVFYHRGKKPYGEMIKHGHDVIFINHEKVASVLLDRMDIVIFIRRADSAGAALMVICKDKGIPTVLDLDDNFLAVPERNPTYVLWGDDPRIVVQHHQNIIQHPRINPTLAFLTEICPQDVVRMALNRRTILTCMIEMANVVTVTVQPLAEVYKQLNDHVFVLPNFIDGDEWVRVNKKSRPGLTLGWAGSNTHYDALAEIEPALRKFLTKNAAARLVTVGVPELHNSLFKDLPTGSLNSLPWMEWPLYQKEIASFDIALAPATLDAFSKGKSPIRAMHANAVGIPVIGSPSTYSSYLKVSGGGLLASRVADWTYALNKLLKPANRKQLGNQGKKYVLSKCTYRANWHLWAELCAKLALRGGS